MSNNNHYDQSRGYQQDAPLYANSGRVAGHEQHRPHLRPALTDLNDFADEPYGQSVNRVGSDGNGDLPPGYLNYDRPPYDGPISPITPGIPVAQHASLGRRTLPVTPRDSTGNRTSSMNGRRPLPAPPGASGSSPVVLNDWDFGPPPQVTINGDRKTLPDPGRRGESVETDMKRASTASSRRPLPPNPNATSSTDTRYSSRPLPPPIPSANPSYLSNTTAANTPSVPLPSPSPYPLSYPGIPVTPSFPGFSLPNPTYGSPIASNFMYPTGSLPPVPPPFVPPGGFLPGYLPPPAFPGMGMGMGAGPGMPPVYPMAPPPELADQQSAGTRYAEVGRPGDDHGDGGQVTPRPTGRRDQQNYFGGPPPPKSPPQKESLEPARQGRSFGQEYLASLSVSDEPEEYSPSIVDSYQRQESEAHLLHSDSYNSNSGQSTDETSINRREGQRSYDYPYGEGPGDATHRESVVSLPQSVRTFGEGPSNPGENGLQHRRTYSRDPQLQHRGSLAPSWLEQNQEGRPPARWVQNKLFLHQSHAAGFSPSEVTGEDGQVDGDGYFDEEMEEDYDEEEAEEQNEMNFFSPSLLSHVSVQLRDRVERNSHIKGGIPWPKSFTGRDVIVS